MIHNFPIKPYNTSISSGYVLDLQWPSQPQVPLVSLLELIFYFVARPIANVLDQMFKARFFRAGPERWGPKDVMSIKSIYNGHDQSLSYIYIYIYIYI